MTEVEWFHATAPGVAWEFVRSRLNRRRLRLFACALCRSGRSQETPVDELLEVSERFADGLATWNELSSVRKRADKLAKEAAQGRCHGFGAGFIDAVRSAAHPDAETAFARVSFPMTDILVREFVGRYFRLATFDPTWRTATVMSLADAIYADRAFDRLPILADALEDAGCTNADVLDHCRQPGEHVRGCWVVDLVLGKE